MILSRGGWAIPYPFAARLVIRGNSGRGSARRMGRTMDAYVVAPVPSHGRGLTTNRLWGITGQGRTSPGKAASVSGSAYVRTFARTFLPRPRGQMRRKVGLELEFPVIRPDGRAAEYAVIDEMFT